MKKGKFGGSSASNPLLLILHALVWTKWKLRSLSLTLSVSLSFCLCLVHRQNFSLILLLSSSPFSHKLRKLSSISSAIPRRDDTPRCEISGKLVCCANPQRNTQQARKQQQELPLLGRLTFYSARRYRHVASILASSLRLHDIPMNKMDRWMDIWIDECTLFCTS
jgi:hypothetical protein